MCRNARFKVFITAVRFLFLVLCSSCEVRGPESTMRAEEIIEMIAIFQVRIESYN